MTTLWLAAILGRGHVGAHSVGRMACGGLALALSGESRELVLRG